ncbi:ABC transporter permease [Demequina sp. NBRC 110054]|uniref:ABC transporter permease n=1 Tax=Demequina sp. NBRC 110054 TaxID=1570343 RepID=UPI0009FBB7AF|nr:ABC transporter permease [Demequina sp. NBRC 110054]
MIRKHRFVALSALLGFAFLYVPLASIILNAFNANENLVSWGGATMQWFAEAVANQDFRDALATSFVIAIIVGALSVTIAFLAALGRRRMRPGAVSAADDLMVLLRMILPEVVIVMSIFLVSRMVDIDLGYPLVIGSQVVYCSAYAFLIIEARLRQLDRVHENAAADLGAGPLSVFLKVTVPMVAPSLLVAFLMTFTFSLDDVVSPTFLGGTSVSTLPTMIMGLVRHGTTAEVNAIAVLAMVISLVPLFAALSFTGVKTLGAVGAKNRS